MEEKVHIINMSLGSSQPSIILRQAIENAFENGVVCICAAGNDASSVSYPAAFETTVAVSAIGEPGFVPLASLPALPNRQELYGKYQWHAADFTNYGSQIDVACPGVGIIAPVPSRLSHDHPFASMNGTSMASPVAVAALSILLSEDKVLIWTRHVSVHVMPVIGCRPLRAQ